MSLGNGYMGLRSANEDSFSDKSRFNLVSGTYDFLDGSNQQKILLAYLEENKSPLLDKVVEFDVRHTCK